MVHESESKWAPEAEAMLANVPPGFCRDMTRRAAETIAGQNAMDRIGPAFVQQVLATFQAGSESSAETMAWEQPARERIGKAPDMVRGMLIKEIEGWSRRKGLQQVTGESGTGKELVARAIHRASNTPDGPFIAVNCAIQMPGSSQQPTWTMITNLKPWKNPYLNAAWRIWKKPI